MGERNPRTAARKSAATKAGLNAARSAGKPVGPVPLGYTVEKKVIDGEGRSPTRVIDPATVATVERIFDLVEAGAHVRRRRPDVEHRGRSAPATPRQPWVTRTISKIVHNRAYIGEKGYPEIIDPDRFDAIHANLDRLDPVAGREAAGWPQAGGRLLLPARDRRSAGRCGSTLYTRRQAVGRVYVCANRRQGTGLCDAPPIPAELIESHVLRHLDCFVGGVEDWIAGRVDDATASAASRRRHSNAPGPS